jgi:predicted transcriptional regulator
MTTDDLRELTAEIVIAHANMNEMSSDDLLKELKMVYATLKNLGKDDIEIPTQEPKKRGRKPKAMVETITVEKPSIPQAPAMTIEEAFKPDQVACMICGKKGLTTLKRHLTTAHNLKPGQYRRQFNIPKDQPLAATDYVAKRRQAALDRGLGDNLAKARAAKKAKQTGE